MIGCVRSYEDQQGSTMEVSVDGSSWSSGDTSLTERVLKWQERKGMGRQHVKGEKASKEIGQ